MRLGWWVGGCGVFGGNRSRFFVDKLIVWRGRGGQEVP